MEPSTAWAARSELGAPKASLRDARMLQEVEGFFWITLSGDDGFFLGVFDGFGEVESRSVVELAKQG